jgi:hypothetical protein
MYVLHFTAVVSRLRRFVEAEKLVERLWHHDLIFSERIAWKSVRDVQLILELAVTDVEDASERVQLSIDGA